MSLKDTARRTAVLSALHEAIGDELKAARNELEAGLKTAKAETGTQKIGVSLTEGEDIGTVGLVQPKAIAIVTDLDKFTAWVMENFDSEIERKFVTQVRATFQKKILAEVAAAGTTDWADPETGVIHEVPGVALQGRAAYTRMSVSEEGKTAIADAWRTGALAHLVLPELTAGGEA